MTSSFAAIGSGSKTKTTFDDNDWTDCAPLLEYWNVSWFSDFYM